MRKDFSFQPVRQIRTRGRRRQKESQLPGREMLCHGAVTLSLPRRRGDLILRRLELWNILPCLSLRPGTGGISSLSGVRRQDGRFSQQHNRDPTVSRQGGVVREERLRRRLAGDLVDPVKLYAGLLKHRPGRIGP